MVLDQRLAENMAKASGRVIAIYTYIDASGEPVRRKSRFDPKGFAWECLTESGWQDGYGNAPDVLYRLPEVRAAVKSGLTVTLVEGEKDADKFVKSGAGVATTAPQNGKWPAGLARPLKYADVMLIWDRDDDGARRARWAMDALDAVGATVECWRAARGKDFSDHLTNGLSVEQLIKEDPPTVAEAATDSYAEREAVDLWLEEAGEHRDRIEQVLEMFAGGEPRDEYLTDEDILNQPPPRWLVEDWIPFGGYTVVYADRGTGKTIMASDVADAVKRGMEWNGYRVMSGTVIVLEGEGTRQLRNVNAALRSRRGDLNGAEPGYYTQTTWDVGSPAGLARLALRVLQREARVVIIDSAGLYSIKNRDGVEDTAMLARACRALAITLDIAVIVLQHTNAMGQPRGTGHLIDWCEAIIKMEQMGSTEVGMFHDVKNRHGHLKAMRMDRVQVGPGMVFDPTRGMKGDEYLPEQFAKEKLSKREAGRAEAAEQRDALFIEEVYGSLSGEMSQSSIIRNLGGKETRVKRALRVLLDDERVISWDGPNRSIMYRRR
jgi:hypothetical protein